MGAFGIEVKMKNWPRFLLPEERHGEDIVCEALVDTDVYDFCVPAELVERLNLTELRGGREVQLPSGEEISCRVFGIVELEVQGRFTQIVASELPEGRGDKVILGRFALSDLDWHISEEGDELVPNPLSPYGEPIGFAISAIDSHWYDTGL